VRAVNRLDGLEVKVQPLGLEVTSPIREGANPLAYLHADTILGSPLPQTVGDGAGVSSNGGASRLPGRP
jgi:hypothetical protein